MKYLLILLFLPSCVTIYVTEKPKLASHISDEHHCGEVVYNDAPIYGGISQITDSVTITYPIWRTNEPIRQDDGSFTCPLVKIGNNSEISNWLKNCDTTFKN